MSTIFEDLIEVVKAHPIIYDIRVEGYQKRGSRREKAWLAVAKCMQQRGHDITSKYLSNSFAVVNYWCNGFRADFSFPN